MLSQLKPQDLLIGGRWLNFIEEDLKHAEATKT